MGNRNHTFEVGEYYHIYNRGVDKRDILVEDEDLYRIMQSIMEFNSEIAIGSIFENSFQKKKKSPLGSLTSKLVSIIAYCVNPNHYHLLITPLVDKGIEKFMHRLGTGYTKYFNEKNIRSGSLFQGSFKSKHVSDNTYLLHLSTYINMNNRDSLGSLTSKLSRSSLEEYTDPNFNRIRVCDTSIVLPQFKSKADYKKFALESWQDTQKRKDAEKEFEI